MNILSNISAQIAQLTTGETWTLSAQDLYMSRDDFSSLSIFLKQESQNGTFSVAIPETLKSWLGSTSLTVTKH
ncbi:MAG TPA: hypothetical protein DIT34_03150 [Acinetobacter ursingii]|uniref:Uncharacterized protein n=4 Tax=Acinetobacter TaxID=469 RepID=N9C4N7_9GAMM|nr:MULTISPECIES: hypothetical protein [Acinetobacter]ECE6725667.1 hypothetical protein [Salmonella enterica subsp. enterica serovar Paratyphi A]MEC8057506.1 hypothetical protein [Pseudomonadota bacterium]NOZ98167.1 hypothetical protein [Gammaproteobacteria bacterium]ENV80476.1 hypothetical protein F942_00644 [Acinetobacter ursingii ANC 3649]ENX49820.1 hypothetical protein F943_01060 [Acinetobacter ursingii NIPH 706]